MLKSQYPSSNSIPIPLRLFSIAASRVVPTAAEWIQYCITNVGK